MKYAIGCILSVGGLALCVFVNFFLGIVVLGIGAYLSFTSDYFEQANKGTYNNSACDCPNCGSNKTRPISSIGRVASVGTFGLASSTIGKQYICDECGHKW